MIEFISWQVRLLLVDYRRRVKDRLLWFTIHQPWAARHGWAHGSWFSQFVDRLSPFDSSSGYKRRRLRHALYIARYPLYWLRFDSLRASLWLLDRTAPYVGPGRFEAHLDPRNHLKAEWLDSHSEYADQSVGDLTIYPLFNQLYASLDVPWSRQPESWILEYDEVGFVIALQYENQTEAEIAFSGAEYRFEQAQDDENEDEELFENREGQPEFNGAFG